jgi:hypothetical protein
MSKVHTCVQKYVEFKTLKILFVLISYRVSSLTVLLPSLARYSGSCHSSVTLALIYITVHIHMHMRSVYRSVPAQLLPLLQLSDSSYTSVTITAMQRYSARFQHIRVWIAVGVTYH